MTTSIAGLVGARALLTWAAWAFGRTATTEWLDRDLTLRAELAVNGARYSLVAAWDAPRRLRDALTRHLQNDQVIIVDNRESSRPSSPGRWTG